MKGICVLSIFLIGMVMFTSCTVKTDWQNDFETKLRLMGHRNWILIADSAYPAQSRPSIETIATGMDQLAILKIVLKAIEQSKHVNANIYLDAELKHVSEQDAPGIENYRNQLNNALEEITVNKLMHEDLIKKLDEAGKTFHVLVLKTNLVLPYTSVFMELDCGYWNSDKEQRLRTEIEKNK